MDKVKDIKIKQSDLPWWHWHRRLYNWVVHFANTKHGVTALFLLSFAESSFFPIPPDILLAPLTLGAPKKWFRFAFACSLASVLGGILGYIIGISLWAGVGNFFHDYVPGFSRDKIVLQSGTELTGMVGKESLKVMPVIKVQTVYPIVVTDIDGTERHIREMEIKNVHLSAFTKIGALYSQHDWKIVAIAGFTPLPYKVITITAGVFEINFLIFLIASALSRSARFFLVAGLFGWKGEKIRPFVEKYFNWLSLAFVVMLIGGFAVLKLIH